MESKQTEADKKRTNLSADSNLACSSADHTAESGAATTGAAAFTSGAGEAGSFGVGAGREAGVGALAAAVALEGLGAALPSAAALSDEVLAAGSGDGEGVVDEEAADIDETDVGGEALRTGTAVASESFLFP